MGGEVLGRGSFATVVALSRTDQMSRNTLLSTAPDLVHMTASHEARHTPCVPVGEARFAVKVCKREELSLILHAQSVPCNAVMTPTHWYVEGDVAVVGMEIGKDLFEEVSAGREVDVRRVCCDIDCAIQHLHALDITHCDVKLENVILVHGSAVLVDFGFAKLGSSDAKRGSPMYWPPSESLIGTKEADWWAFGILLFACATGAFPFDQNHANETYKRHLAGERLRDIVKRPSDDSWLWFRIENLLAVFGTLDPNVA